MKAAIAFVGACFFTTVIFAQAPAQKAAVKPAPAPAAKPAPAPPAPAPAAKPGTAADAGYKFDTTDHDYGTIAKGSDPYCEFHLTNTSKEPLVIKEAHGSCGCTVPEYPKEPIKPGATVTIKVRYDTNRIGPFEKQVTMTFEGKDQPAVLHIHGKVEAPPAEQPFPAPGQGGSQGGAPVNN
jgi:hypothetical protein